MSFQSSTRLRPLVLTTAGVLILISFLLTQEKVTWSAQEQPIAEQLRGLRKLNDAVRMRTTKVLALQIRQLPVVPNKLRLAGALANLSTEGDSDATRCRK